VKQAYPQALQKDEEALRDLSAFAFPDEEAKDRAYAKLFEALAGTYNKLNQYDKEIAYETAAVAYGGPSPYEHLICNAYIQMQAFQEAVDACTPFLNGPDAIESRYWRAAAYHDLNQPDAEAADLRIIADSENMQFRTAALIRLSVYYADRKDYRAMIDLFDAHPYAFDESAQRKDDLAVIYNNRCYAYMQLGDLHKALDDCTTSLRFGSIPDAYHKQQELVSRLAAASKP
jgi:tetratricopeptide (TPR) repeat protein